MDGLAAEPDQTFRPWSLKSALTDHPLQNGDRSGELGIRACLFLLTVFHSSGDGNLKNHAKRLVVTVLLLTAHEEKTPGLNCTAYRYRGCK